MGHGFKHGAGGISGGTLTVTAPAGVTVTVSKDGKTKTKTASADGVAVFRGLATGAWNVTITDGIQTATKEVTVTADYSTVMAFFSSTINVTYPAGSICSASDGTTTLTAPDTSGTWACIVPNTGTWTISCTDGTDSAYGSVSITADGQSKSVTLAYELVLLGDGVNIIGTPTAYTYSSASYDGSVGLSEKSDGTYDLSVYAPSETWAYTTASFPKGVSIGDYNTLEITAKLLSFSISSPGDFQIGVRTGSKFTSGDLPSYEDAGATLYPSGSSPSSKYATVEIDLSGLSGKLFLGFCSYNAQAGQGAEINIKKIRLY